MKDCDDPEERKRLVDHLQDRHGPGLTIGKAATIEHLSQLHTDRHDAGDGAGYWPGGSEGPHDRTDLSSWEEAKRLVTNGSSSNTQISLDKLIEFHKQHHDIMEQLYDRDDLTWKLHEPDNLT